MRGAARQEIHFAPRCFADKLSFSQQRAPLACASRWLAILITLKFLIIFRIKHAQLIPALKQGFLRAINKPAFAFLATMQLISRPQSQEQHAPCR
ncbi:hypothetical protein D6817_02120 [Candidatus Pacearchaeota archaeon]|nr:MAG: hypothetical protein D6817_02120 [Candidatus Pacearchaeota archaeon]